MRTIMSILTRWCLLLLLFGQCLLPSMLSAAAGHQHRRRSRNSAVKSLFTALAIPDSADSDDRPAGRQRRTLVEGPRYFGFTRPEYNVSIPENSRGRVFADQMMPAGQRMGIYVPHPDGVVRYKIVTGDTNDFFKAVAYTIGNFAYLRIRIRPTLAVSLNREFEDKYRLLVKATFKQPERNILETRATVNVIISDENDLVPLFLPDSLEETVSDDLPVFSEITQVYASDADLGLNSEVYYSLIEPSTHFTVHPVTGKIRLIAPLDAQQQSTYKLLIRAQDRASRITSGPGRPPRDVEEVVKTTVTIRVTQANRHPPTVLLSNAAPSVEHGRRDSQIVADIRVEDDDPDVHGQVQAVALLGDPDGWFRIRPSKTDEKKFTLETLPGDMLPSSISQFNLTIVVTDAGTPSRTTQTPVTVMVNQRSGNKAQFTKDLFTFYVNETSPNWTIVGALTLQRAKYRPDPSSPSPVHFLIRGTTAVPFDLNSTTGTIRVGEPLDFETTKSYKFTTELRQDNELVDTCTVHIQVLDENDNGPEFSADSVNAALVLDPKLVAVESTVFQVSASDRDSSDNGRLSYRLLNVDQPTPFILDEWTGEIKLRSPFSSYDQSSWSLGIRVTDWGRPIRRENETSLSIRLKSAPDRLWKRESMFRDSVAMSSWIPRNQYSPVFGTKGTLSTSVREDVNRGEIVYCVTATDDDFGYAGLVQYTIDPSTDNLDLFDIGLYDGCISVMNNLTDRYLDINQVVLSVRANDMGIPKKQATLQIAVNIDDVNDHKPVFDRSRYRVRISEDASYPTELLSVHASDRDQSGSDNALVQYSMLTRTDQFNIDTKTGVVSLTGQLDRERKASYELTVVARDLGSSSLESTAQILVEVQDVNDNAPRCLTDVQKVQLVEDWPASALVTCIQAQDPDDGLNGKFTFGLDTTTASKSTLPFTIDPTTGCIWIAPDTTLDYETRPAYNLTVEVTDRGQPSFSGVCRLIIELIDVNENLHPPEFEQFADQAQVFENQPIGTEVGRVLAHDPERPDDKVMFSLMSDQALGLFTIDNEGVLRTAAVFDREQTDHYWLTVVARDRDLMHPLEAYMDMYITIADRNDHAPLVQHEPLVHASVPENSPPGRMVTRIQAIDPDTGKSEGLTYRIVRGDPQSFFTIDSVTGYITTHRRRLDRETLEEHELEVQITDSGSPTLSSTCLVVVRVTDVNDVPPTFTHPVYSFNVPEVRNNARTLLCRVTAYDGDTGVDSQLTYNISKIDQDKFDIDAATGAIYAIQNIKPKERFTLTVGVSDGEHTASCRVTMDVLPIGLDSGNSAPTVRSSKPIELLISDSDKVGQMLALLEANDADGNHLWFDVIGDADTAKQFTFRRDTGELQLLRPLDPLNAPQEYHMIYSVTDGRDTIEAQAHIRIRRTVASRPRFQNDQVQVSITENTAIGTTVAQLEATVNTTSGSDATITYSLHATINTHAANTFKVEPSTGRVVLVDSLDREVSRSYVMIVAARHRNLLALCQLNITVTDVNDHTPVFTQNRYSISVMETASTGTTVLTLSATDRDTGNNSRIAYSIVSGNEQNLWSLNAVSGDLKVANRLSLTYPESVLVVRASDSGRPVRSHTATVRIMVGMAVESAPRFTRKVYTTKLFESSSIGSYVTAVFADSTNGVLYSFEDDTSRYQAFSLHPTSGVLSLMAHLDYETRPSYNLTVIATSSTGHESSCQVIVNVLDSNDHAPVFNTLIYNGVLAENLPTGTVVTSSSGQPLVISASDGDRGANALLSYHIITDWAKEYFTVDYGTGAVRTTRPLDYEKKSSYTFEVGAMDLGEPPRGASVAALVNVSMIDVNDNPPQLLLANDRVVVTLPTMKGVLITKLTATDADSVGTLTYSLESGCDRFCVDAKTGEVTVHNATGMGKNNKPVTLNIRVTDGVHKSSARLTIVTEDLSSSGLKFMQSSYSVSVVENVTSTTQQSVLVLNVIGTELGEQVTYSLLNNNEWFVLGAVTGELRTTGIALDRERTPEMWLVVMATDARHPPRRAQTVVKVHIQDINDCAPTFVRQPYYAVVPLDAQTNDNVSVSIVAIDADQDDNAKVRYSIEGGTSGTQHFGIDSTSARLTVSRPFDQSQGATKYTLTIVARDLGTPSLTSKTQIVISVVDAAMPVFSEAMYSTEILESLAVGQQVITVSAMSHVGGSIGYAIVDGDQDGLFELDYVAGTVRVRRPLDRDTKSSHKLTIRAVDVAKRDVFADVPMHIKLLDVNDNHPVFTQQSYSVRVPENAAMGTRLLQVSASDADLGDSAIVSYTLDNSANAHSFEINRDTGELYLMRTLDFEQQSTYILSVTAADQGQPVMSTSVKVTINVVDVNDCPPQFEHEIHTASVVDNCDTGHFITKLLATDKDTESNLTYAIIDGDASPPLFKVQPSTGIVMANRPFAIDELSIPVYHLNVSVSDGVYSSTCMLNIQVVSTASRTSAPVFERQHYDSWLTENELPGAAVITVKAVGGAQPLKYSLGGDVRHSVFVIDSQSGHVTLSGTLDYEKHRVHHLPLVATDTAGRRTFATVTVNIRDHNDNAPVFVAEKYSVAVPLNTSLGVPILYVLAIDPDVDDIVEYSMDSDEGKDLWFYFDLHQRSGKLSVRHELSKLAGRTLSFTVRAADRGNPPLSNDVPVTIHVVDAKTKVPRTAQAQYKFDIGEEVQLNTKIGDIGIVESKEHLLTIVSSADGNTVPFAIDGTGKLSVQSLLDRELNDEYNFVLAVADRRNTRLQSHCNVQVKINDANDNSPKFQASYESLEISEDAGIGSSLAVLSATDDDLGVASEISFQLKPSVHFPIDLFRVDAASGWLMLNGVLDRETRDSYEFTVMAVDGGYPSLTTTTTVRLRVLDSNDCSPQFIYPSGAGSYEFRVTESASAGTVVGSLQVWDEDLAPNNITHMFIVDGDPDGHFGVRDNGDVFVRTRLDYERMQMHRLTVLASDGLHVNKTTVIVRVTDENDNAPVCQTDKTSITISENTEVGSEIYILVADDADAGDNAKLTFSIGQREGGDDGLFAISDKGVLTLTAALDREHEDTHSIVLLAGDAAGQACQTRLTINVLDVNDNVPTFEESVYRVEVEENVETEGMLLQQLVAVDPDLGKSGSVHYSLQSANTSVLPQDIVKSTFYMDKLTGALLVLKPLDRETRNFYNLTVIASDQGEPKLTGEARVNVIVTDVNDCPPVFERLDYVTSVVESAPVNQPLLTVTAVSDDDVHNARISYQFVKSTSTGDVISYDKFALDQRSGKISLAGTLDYESVKSYTLLVEATDSGTPPLKTRTSVIINVVDENDNGPEFTQQQYSVNLMENATIGAKVIQLVAHDRDSGANGLVKYTVANTTAYWDVFNVTENGTVVLMETLDREKLDHYRLVIEACDQGVPERKCDQAVLLVTLTDVNDNPPKFDSCNFTSTVPEASPSGFEVFRVSVSDDDLAPNADPFVFDIVGPGNDYFAISDQGHLTVAKKLRYDKQSSFLLTVVAKDAGTPPLKSECPVTIQLIEESKYAPEVQSLEVDIVSYLGEFAGAVVGRIEASDKDANDRLEYAIVPPVDGSRSMFEIDSQDGTVTALAGLAVGQHQVNVSVTDQKFTTYGLIKANIQLVTEDTLQFALSMELHGVSTDRLFNDGFRKKFSKAVADILGVPAEHIELISVQDAAKKSSSVDVYRARHNLMFRAKRQATSDASDNKVQLLFTVSKGDNTYFTPSLISRRLGMEIETLKEKLEVPLIQLVTEVCRRDKCVRGDCRDKLNVHDTDVTVVRHKASGQVFMSPRHEKTFQCICQQGFGGPTCNAAVNACSREPCDTNELCVPLDSSAGYECICIGNACPKTQCEQGRCAFDSPMSFSGNSYLQYTLSSPLTRRLQLKMQIRTKAANGVLMHMHGNNDFHTLQVRNGFLEYLFDCGSGLAMVAVTSVPVDDGSWHWVEVTRRDNFASLTVDERNNANTSAPGVNTVLNLYNNDMYFGGEVYAHPDLYGYQEIKRAFMGCIDKIYVDQYELPRSKPGFNVYNVKFQCKDSFIAGVCSAQPCKHFGTCVQQLGDSYTCECNKRYTGRHCEIDRNPCASNPCVGGATCVNGFNQAICRCPPGRSGTTCADTSDVNVPGGGTVCQPNPCLNQGECVPVFGSGSSVGYKCVCGDNWTGPTCQLENSTPNIIGNYLGLSLLELAAIALAVVTLILLALLCCCCCRRRHRYRYEKAPYMPNTANELILEQNPHLRNPHVLGTNNNNLTSAPPLPPRAGRGAVPAFYAPTRPPHQQLSNLQAAQMTGLPTGLVRPLSIADRGGPNGSSSPSSKHQNGHVADDGSSSCGGAGSHHAFQQSRNIRNRHTAIDYGSAAGSFEQIGSPKEPRFSDVAPPLPAHKALGGDGPDLNAPPEYDAPPRPRKNSMNSIQCLPEDDVSTNDAGRALMAPRKPQSSSQWDYAGSDWASTLGVNPPYDDGHSTLPPGVSALDDDDDDLPLGDVNVNDLKSSPQFRQQLLALQRMNNDADALARQNRTPRERPLRVVAPSTLREDEYVTMRPAAMRQIRDRQASEQRQPLMNTAYDVRSSEDDDEDADSCGAVVQYDQPSSRAPPAPAPSSNLYDAPAVSHASPMKSGAFSGQMSSVQGSASDLSGICAIDDDDDDDRGLRTKTANV